MVTTYPCVAKLALFANVCSNKHGLHYASYFCETDCKRYSFQKVLIFPHNSEWTRNSRVLSEETASALDLPCRGVFLVLFGDMVKQTSLGMFLTFWFCDIAIVFVSVFSFRPPRRRIVFYLKTIIAYSLKRTSKGLSCVLISLLNLQFSFKQDITFSLVLERFWSINAFSLHCSRILVLTVRLRSYLAFGPVQ